MPETQGQSTGIMPHTRATGLPDRTGTPVVVGIPNESSSRMSAFMSMLMGRLNRLIMILVYPFMVIFTVITLLLVITFCVFPTLICMTIGVCIYYCMIDDPIPLSVLLQYMLSTDPNEDPFMDYHSGTQQSRSSMQAKLIVRKVLKVEDLEHTEGEGDDDKVPAQQHPRNHPGPIEFKTSRKCLYFSEPIPYEDNDDHSLVDKSSGGRTGPLQQRRQHDDDMELYQGSALLQLSTVLATPPDDDEIGLVEIAIGSAESEDWTAEPGLSRTASEDLEGGLQETGAGSTQPKGETTLGDENDDKGQSGAKSALASEAHGATATEHLKGALELVEDYFGITDSRETGTTCDICLLGFEDDDEVAWSPNLDCVHTYHKDCILDWLQRQPTCPSCRRDYLEAKDDKNV